MLNVVPVIQHSTFNIPRLLSVTFLRNLHLFPLPPPDHRTDPPPPLPFEQLDAVHAAVEELAAARAARLVGAQHVRHVAEQAGLAPQLPLPEARHFAGVDHAIEVAAIALEIEGKD